MKPQTLAVKNYLLKHNSLTPLQAWRKLRIYRVAANIRELRIAGYSILTVRGTHDGKRFARYVQG